MAYIIRSSHRERNQRRDKAVNALVDQYGGDLGRRNMGKKDRPFEGAPSGQEAAILQDRWGQLQRNIAAQYGIHGPDDQANVGVKVAVGEGGKAEPGKPLGPGARFERE